VRFELERAREAQGREAAQLHSQIEILKVSTGPPRILDLLSYTYSVVEFEVGAIGVRVIE
jgi:hypothetical protein